MHSLTPRDKLGSLVMHRAQPQLGVRRWAWGTDLGTPVMSSAYLLRTRALAIRAAALETVDEGAGWRLAWIAERFEQLADRVAARGRARPDRATSLHKDA
jgi:hypothetical protein